MSIADILDRFFESEQVKTVMALNGLIGTWAGPHEPGTGYVMAHHMIGDVGDGHLGSWATPVGGMGAVAAALESSARSFGADVRTNARVDQDPDGGRRRPRRGAGGRGGADGADRRGRYAPADHVPAAARPRRAPGRVPARHPQLEEPQRHREDQPRAGPGAGVHRGPRAPGPHRRLRAGALDPVPRDGVRAGAGRDGGDRAVLRRGHAHVPRSVARAGGQARGLAVHTVVPRRVVARAAP